MLALCGRENPDYKFGIGIVIVILATVRTGLKEQPLVPKSPVRSDKILASE